uniref:Tripartite motif-containing protein 3 n=1 Tax=Magallana gigas TaxID=29159 RepID=K1PKJ2_MAGGI
MEACNKSLESRLTICDQDQTTADVIKSLTEIPTTWTEETQKENERLWKLSSPIFFQLKGVRRFYHISCVTSDRVWVSDDRNNLMLTDTTGVPLHRLEDSCSDPFTGFHTVNSESELIYIDEDNNINKLSKDMKTTTTFKERTGSTWRPRCVYWSPSTGDLLVGMSMYWTFTGKVTRYNESGKLTQTIQHDNTGLELYQDPSFITENNNEDVVVSDPFNAVVVTERGGRHRFSYKGHPSGSELLPHGICTDSLSHILVCDGKSKTIHILDSDGQFLSQLLTKSQEMGEPWGLNYDANTQCLWVGSGVNNTLCVYMYTSRKDALTDEHTPGPDGNALFSLTPATCYKQVGYGQKWPPDSRLSESRTWPGLAAVFQTAH